MTLYKVTGTVNINVEIIVEADSPEQAIERAEDELPELTPFAGNGGSDKLVGTDLDEVVLDCSDVVIYTHAEVI